MSDHDRERLNVNDIEKQMVRCRFCRQEVQFGVLPYHQYFCEKAQNRPSQPSAISPFRITPARP